MPSTHLAHMYKDLLGENRALPASLLRRLWQHAAQAGDEDLLLRVINRLDAPADLLSQFAAQTSAKARIAYLGRPGLGPEELGGVIASEKRVTVLAALANSEATPAPVFAALATQMWERKSQQLATALLRSPHTPSPALLEAIRFFDHKTTEPSYTLVKDVTAACERLETTEADNAILTLAPLYYAPLVMRTGLSTQARLHAIAEYVTMSCEGVRLSNWGNHSAAVVVPRLLEVPDLQLDVLAALDALLARDDILIGEDVVAKCRSALIHRSGGLLRADMSEQDRAARRQVLTAAQNPETGPASLAALAADATRDSDIALAALLAANPATPATAAVALIGLLDSEEKVDASYRAQADAPGRDPVRLALLTTHPRLLVHQPDRLGDPTIRVAALGDFDDPTAAAPVLCAAFAQQATAPEASSPARGGSRPSLQALLELVSDPLSSAEAPATYLPWRYVRDSMLRHYSPVEQASRDEVAARLFDLQERVLGESETSWHVFEEIEGDFPGTLAELFATVAGIAAAS